MRSMYIYIYIYSLVPVFPKCGRKCIQNKMEDRLYKRRTEFQKSNKKLYDK